MALERTSIMSSEVLKNGENLNTSQKVEDFIRDEHEGEAHQRGKHVTSASYSIRTRRILYIYSGFKVIL